MITNLQVYKSWSRYWFHKGHIFYSGGSKISLNWVLQYQNKLLCDMINTDI